jgi:glycosyltransferase involved in cell wall biosynthesis
MDSQALTLPEHALAAVDDVGGRPLHILVLTDRDWTHPQGGGTGVSLLGHIRHWLDGGHSVTVLAGSYPGAVEHECDGRLTVYRRGGRVTVFPHAIWRLSRGLVPDADVVLEIINGISFLTPLWLRLPRLCYVHHVHREQYLSELGLLGRIAAFWAETVPLRRLYRRSRFVTVSYSTKHQLTELGIPADAVEVHYNGPEPDNYEPGPRSEVPTLLYLGRLKRYKRVELLLDAVAELPGVTLDIAGDGDHRPVLEAEIRARGLTGRVHVHGFVDEDTKLALLQQAWVLVTASSAEGWGINVLEAAACATPAVALAVGGLIEAIQDGHTGLLAGDADEFVAQIQRMLGDAELRARLGEAALLRARTMGWGESAALTLAALRAELDPRATTPAPLTPLTAAQSTVD